MIKHLHYNTWDILITSLQVRSALQILGKLTIPTMGNTITLPAMHSAPSHKILLPSDLTTYDECYQLTFQLPLLINQNITTNSRKFIQCSFYTHSHRSSPHK